MKDPNLWIKIQMISAVVGDMKSWIGIAALVLAATANAKRLERAAPAPSARLERGSIVLRMGRSQTPLRFSSFEEAESMLNVLTALGDHFMQKMEPERRSLRASGPETMMALVETESGAGTEAQCSEFCRCMASELLYGATKTLPYVQNFENSNGFKCYEFDADSATPIWYRYDEPEGQWYWTPAKPDSNEEHGSSHWSASDTHDVNGGFWSWMQNIGIADLAPVNKELVDLLHQVNPRPSRASAASNPDERNIHEDMAMCYERLGIEDTCLCSRASCLRSMRERYQTLNTALAQAAKRARVKQRLLTAFQFALDLLGLIPGIGFVFDLVNAAINAVRQKWLDMTFSLLAAIPLIGHVVTGAKFMIKGTRAVSALAPLAKRVFTVVKRVAGSKKLRRILSLVADKVKGIRLTDMSSLTDEVGRFAGDMMQAGHTLRRGVDQAGNLRRVLKSAVSNEQKLKFVQTQLGKVAARIKCGNTPEILVVTLEALARTMQLFSPLEDAGMWLSSAFKCLRVCVDGEAGDVFASLNGCAGKVKSSLEATFNGEAASVAPTPATPANNALQPEGSNSGGGSDVDCVLEDVARRYNNIELCTPDVCSWSPRMLVHRDFTASMAKLDEAAAACRTRVLVTASFRASAAGANAQRAAGYGVHINIYKSDNSLCNSECLMTPGEKEQAVACVLDKVEQEPLLRWRGAEGAAVVDGALGREDLTQATREAQVAASTMCYDHTLQAVNELVEAEISAAPTNALPEADTATDREECEELEEASRQPGAMNDQSPEGATGEEAIEWVFLDDSDQVTDPAELRGINDPSTITTSGHADVPPALYENIV